MNCRVLTNQSAIKKAVEDEIKNRMPDIAKEHSVQLLAAVLTTLNKDYNHTPTYCRQFFFKVNELFNLMDKPIMNKTFDVDDCINYCRDRLGIDLEKEITATVKVK